MGFTVLLRINIVASLLLITTPLLALSAQHFSASYYLADGNGYEELPVQKSSSSQKIELACQASQYPDFCKSSLQSNGHISENAGAEEIIVAAIVLSQQATEQSYITLKDHHYYRANSQGASIQFQNPIYRSFNESGKGGQECDRTQFTGASTRQVRVGWSVTRPNYEFWVRLKTRKLGLALKKEGPSETESKWRKDRNVELFIPWRLQPMV